MAHARWQASPHPIVRGLGKSWARHLVALRDAAVELRALRCALAVARGQPAPPIEDPFGFTATVTEEADAVVVSVPRRFSSPVEVRVRR